MLACQRLNKGILLISLALFFSTPALAQWTTRDPLASPPPPLPNAAPQPYQNETIIQPQPAPVVPAPPAYEYQPATGTAPQLPQGYQPSHSALDPKETDNVPAAPPPVNTYALDEEGSSSSLSVKSAELGPPEDQTPEIIKHKEDKRSYIAVKLQGLDKITARRQEMEATMGTVTSFGNLEIVPRACWQSQEEDKPDAAALLEIWQWKSGEKPSFVFFGWMFASSPALSSLEHPIYDLAVLQCVEDPAEAKKRHAQKQKEDAANNTAVKKESTETTIEEPLD